MSFQKLDSVISLSYQYGMIESFELGKDGIIRKAKVKYRNHNENADRETFRSVRQLVIIHLVDELNLMRELGQVANIADLKLNLEIQL